MKKLYKIILSILLCVTMLPHKQIFAATGTSYTPFPQVEYGHTSDVSTGTIRYISQIKSSSYFNPNYWPASAFGNYSGPGNECGTASISMALSYIGINKTPKEILEKYNGKTVFDGGWGATYLTTTIDTGMSNYINGNGKYSPVIVHFTTGYTSGTHFVLLIGQVSSTSWLVLDPAKDSTWILSTSDSKYKGIDSVRQYYNPNASIEQPPIGYLDIATGGEDSIYVKGWAFDFDDPSASLAMHIYVDGQYAAQCMADQYYKGVNDVYGSGYYHGFECTFDYPVTQEGEHVVSVYALNLNGTHNPQVTQSPMTVTVKPKSYIKIKNYDLPTKIVEGNDYTFSGTVYSSNKMQIVFLGVFDLDSNRVIATEKRDMSVDTFDLSEFNNALDFSSIAAGEYSLEVHAVDCNGNYYIPYSQSLIVEGKSADKPITSVSLNKTSLTLVEGGNETLKATINPSNTTDSKTLTWSSSNTSVATVSSGKVTAKAPGTATITVTTSNGKTATCTVTVKKREGGITGVSLDRTSVSLNYGATTKLVATITPSNTVDSKKITWKSSNSSIASVDSTGKVTAKAPGTVTITAKTSNGLTATCEVTVKFKDITTKVSRSSDTALKVSWNKVSGATGYVVYRATSYDGEYKKVKTITKGTTLSWTDTKKTNGTTYFYKVRAYRTVNKKNYYGGYSEVVGYAALKTPSVTAKADGYSSNLLTWKAIAKAEYYEVYRSTSKDKNYEKVTTTSSLSYVDSGLTAGKTYYYKVKAVKNCTTGVAKSAYSAVKSAKPTLTAPKLTVTNPTYYYNELSWPSISGASGYQIYRATSKDGKYTKVKETSSTYYYDESVTLGSTYYYKVRAYREVNGTKGYSSYSSIVGKKVSFSTISVSVKSNSYNSLSVSFNSVSGAEGYEVYRSTSKNGTYKKIKTTTSTSFVDTGRTTGTTYYYKVRGYRTYNGTKKYGSYSSVVGKAPALGKPPWIEAIIREFGTDVGFGEVEGAHGYEIYRCSTSNGTYKKIDTIEKMMANPFYDTTKVYYYKIRAYRKVNGKKVYSPYSDIVKAIYSYW